MNKYSGDINFISPRSFELAMRLVATSLMVLCEAPEDLIVAARHALTSRSTRGKRKKKQNNNIDKP